MSGFKDMPEAALRHNLEHLASLEIDVHLLRRNHSNSLSTWPALGLRTAEMDRLIERSEQTLDSTERAKIIKELQLIAMKGYTGFRSLFTTEDTYFLKPEVMDYEVIPNYSAWVQPQMWLKK